MCRLQALSASSSRPGESAKKYRFWPGREHARRCARRDLGGAASGRIGPVRPRKRRVSSLSCQSAGPEFTEQRHHNDVLAGQPWRNLDRHPGRRHEPFAAGYVCKPEIRDHCNGRGPGCRRDRQHHRRRPPCTVDQHDRRHQPLRPGQRPHRQFRTIRRHLVAGLLHQCRHRASRSPHSFRRAVGRNAFRSAATDSRTDPGAGTHGRAAQQPTGRPALAGCRLTAATGAVERRHRDVPQSPAQHRFRVQRVRIR